MRKLIARQSQQLPRRYRSCETAEVGVVIVLILKNVAHAAKNFVAEHDGGDKFASANAFMLRNGKHWGHEVAGMTLIASGPVIGIHHVQLSRSCGIDERRHIGSRVYSRTDNC